MKDNISTARLSEEQIMEIDIIILLILKINLYISALMNRANK